MKRLLILLVLFSVQSYALTTGFYSTVDSNRELCTQKVRVHEYDNGDRSLEIAYVGQCGYLGPYHYYCKSNICSNGPIEIEILGEASYRWIHRSHHFWGVFEKEQ